MYFSGSPNFRKETHHDLPRQLYLTKRNSGTDCRARLGSIARSDLCCGKCNDKGQTQQRYLGVAFLGLRAAWKSVPPEQKTPLTGREVFARSALSLLISNLFVVLNVLAPLALVLITIVMIAPLRPENPSVQQGVQSVGEIVLTYFNVTFSSALNLIILLPMAAGGAALLLWTFWRWLNRRGEAESQMEQV